MLNNYLYFLYKNLNNYSNLYENSNSILNNVNIKGGGGEQVTDIFKHLFKQIEDDINKLIKSRD